LIVFIANILFLADKGKKMWQKSCFHSYLAELVDVAGER
jgi:hypothetical protein